MYLRTDDTAGCIHNTVEVSSPSNETPFFTV